MLRRQFILSLLAAGAGLAAAPALARSLSGNSSAGDKFDILGIDSHAHVFARDLKLDAQRRYAPDYDATVADYLAMLDANGLSHGVLIQPSFLGTDNSYLVKALQAAPERLRGVAVLPPDVDPAEMQALDREGVVGLRQNLFGKPNPDFNSPVWQRHLAEMAKLGWQMEVHAEAQRLPDLLPPLLNAGLRVVVDHFGRPKPELGVEDPGFRYLLSLGSTRQVWVKVSAAYRAGGEAVTMAAMPLLRDAYGLDRLLWGTDWPHTQHEKTESPAAARRMAEIWLPDPADRRVVMAETPARLFRFRVES